METIKYYTLAALAEQTGLSKRYLRALANEKKIPFLFVGGRLRFNPAQVQAALDRLAAKGAGNE